MPHPDRRFPRWLRIVTVGLALFVVAAAVTGVVRLLDSDPAPADVKIGTGHGPTKLIDGVPAGYAHDAAGAATAAVNVVQMLAQAGVGVADGAAINRVMIGTPASQSLQDTVARNSNRERLDSTLTVAVTHPPIVFGYTDQEATVRIEVVGVSIGKAVPVEGAPVVSSARWSEHTVTVAWQQGDWKAIDIASHAAPGPGGEVAATEGTAFPSFLTMILAN